MSDTEFYIKELMSNECACHKRKRASHSFCYNCYRALPKEMKGPLWRKIGQGYEAAYEEAHAWLRNNLWEV